MSQIRHVYPTLQKWRVHGENRTPEDPRIDGPNPLIKIDYDWQPRKCHMNCLAGTLAHYRFPPNDNVKRAFRHSLSVYHNLHVVKQ